jgi:hypothetical protein
VTSRFRSSFRSLCIALLVLAASSHGQTVLDTPLGEGTSASAPRALWLGDRFLLAFYDAQGFLSIAPAAPDSRVRRISPEGLPDVVNSLIDFSRQGDHLFLVWRPKIAQGDLRGHKLILFSASHDGGKSFSEPMRLNSEGGAFHPLPLARGENGALYLVWADERSRPDGIYFNRSTDFGRTWLRSELRMDRLDTLEEAKAKPKAGGKRFKPGAVAYDPFFAVEGRRLWLGWNEIGAEPPYHLNTLKLRTSDDGGESWSEAVELPSPGAKTFNPTLLVTGGEELTLLYWVQRKGIMWTLSRDGGRSWSPARLIGGTGEVGGQRFKAARDGKGTLCLTWEGPNRLHGRKADVFVTCSQEQGQSWPERPIRLDSDVPFRDHSLAPHLAMDDAGNVVVAWRDSRHIRPRIYLNYSRDSGRTWRGTDNALEKRDGVWQSTYPWVESAGDGRFLVAWPMRLGDSVEAEHRLAYRSFTLPGSHDTVAQEGFPVLRWKTEPSLTETQEERRRQRLVERMHEYWEARKANDYAKAFSMMDPFYRAGSNLLSYGAPLSKIQYPAYEILGNEIQIVGNRAKVKVRVTQEATTLIVKHIRTTIPRQDFTEEGSWIWLDGDWFKVFESGRSSFVPL